MPNHHAELERVIDIGAYTVPAETVAENQLVFTVPQLGIGTVRDLIAAAHRRPAGEKKYQKLVVITRYITVEAQQALLKVVEEPPESTSFLFIVPQSLQLLPTLLSRLAEKENHDKRGVCHIDAFIAFLEAGVKERFAQIETAIKQKDTTWVSNIRCGLIDHLSQSVGVYTEEKLTSLQFVVSTLETRGAANKMLLEELALTL